jgi:periplasmic divalent cation tolerance protein
VLLEGEAMAEEIIVLITASSQDEAFRIGTALVDEHLVACVNIIPGVRSLFFWEGKTQDADETLLIGKSRQPLLEQLIARVKALHSYTVPEVIALPIVGGSEGYLQWLNQTTKL